MDGVDLVNRDPNELNSHIKVNYEDVLAEPDGIRSFDCVWRCSYGCFNCGKNCVYKLMTTLCGLCIAFLWGCDFGCLAYHHVWCYTPYMREFAIGCGYLQKCFGTVINCCLAPICEACGMCFSKIHVQNSGK
ncbi:hypothetical protein CHS0354_038422 [Potamilus streckersoni]|uniref:Caveolin n=1 Tax=Potamilus streckersoni TaxID=2493646 RepID=A0AAE0VQV8_9BIVA|nr:hypothetical protein CHS0354_038422 [Potamilus streckersoni]